MKNTVLKASKAAGDAFKRKALTLSAAESCTGGAVLNALTNIAGSSRYVAGGVVAYSNRVKVEQLGVEQSAINEYGAVSKTVALQMAESIAVLMNTDIGLSTTGIAGPGGGSEQKPVGTVWIGFYSEASHFALKANFKGTRLKTKQQTVETALEIARRSVLNIDEMPANLVRYPADDE